MAICEGCLLPNDEHDEGRLDQVNFTVEIERK